MNYQINCLFFVLACTFALHVDENCTIREFSKVDEVTKACTNIKISNLHVPAKQTLNINLQNGSNLVFEGRTHFDYYEWKGPLIKIKGNKLIITGDPDSVIDGQGELYWDAFGGSGGKKKPRLMKLDVTNSRIEHINIKNCPVQCVHVNADHLIINNWNIDVSEGSKNNFTGHNTDGFDVKGTNIIITNTVVKNQDDCVAINTGSNFLVSNMLCSGGHGLSISVGGNSSFELSSVHNVTIENSVVEESNNGLHIKTHTDAGQGIIKNVTYRNIQFKNIHNYSLNIQQDYKDGKSTGIPKNNIPIVDLTLENIWGTMQSYHHSPTLEAQIICGEGSCVNWKFKGIRIEGAKNGSFCNYEPEGYTCPGNRRTIPF